MLGHHLKVSEHVCNTCGKGFYEKKVYLLRLHAPFKSVTLICKLEHTSGKHKGSFTSSVCFCVSDFIWVPLLSRVLVAPNDGRYRQTSKEMIGNPDDECEQARTIIAIHVLKIFRLGIDLARESSQETE